MAASTVPILPLTPPERLSPAHGFQHELLLISTTPDAAAYSGVLRLMYRVLSTPNGEAAKQYLVKGTPSLVVIDVDTSSEAALIILAAKKLAAPPTVLIATDDTRHVPDLLEAGCDAVLLKPFPPNLLSARVGRLLRSREDQQRSRVRIGRELSATTNRVWQDEACPHCQQGGAIGFEFASHRRAWYACLGCKQVWMAKRRE